MDNCIFCKIVKGDISSFKIYEDEKYLAILDIAHFVEGHTIVIPKVHHRFVWDVEDLGYFEVTKKVSNHFKTLGYEFVDSMIFGRMVPHAHIHLLPHNGDNEEYNNSLKGIGELQQDSNRRLSKEEGEKVLTKFRLP